MGVRFVLLAVCAWLGGAAWGGAPGDEVVVVFNRASQASREIAQHYAQARAVPPGQVFGFDLPETETISRADFEGKLRRPLWRELTSRRLFLTNGPAAPVSSVSAAGIRYAVLCYGVPVKILPDPNLKEEGAESVQLELRRNEAAVDSELAILPMFGKPYLLAGPIVNPVQGATNSAAIDPAHGVLIVARLDGPTPEIANALVDKALAAERDGLWGRAYFDWRGVGEGPYKIGDDWIKTAAELARGYGFETIVDSQPATFPPATPMSDIALYFGWYDQSVSGPFTNGMTSFSPGAIAYHLHSYSARSLRVADAWWAGPLLDRGATATMGCTEEPFLQATPQIHIFLHRLLFSRLTFGEAAYASQNALSWQITVVGDPLYRPFAKTQPERHAELEARQDQRLEWSMLMWINVRLQQGAALDEILQFYRSNPLTKTSSVLQEKLGDIYNARGKLIDAMDPYLAALKLDPPPLRRLRITLSVSSLLSSFGRPEQAFQLYQELVRDFPDYPRKKDLYSRLARLAERLEKKDQAAEYQRLAAGS